ncbi:hypothetical protein Za10_1687 [Zymomonas mobilis subsp. mobilis NCIMB 11163]|nr:hypothetical protein Za10_1687 [Zymomonas mobilis subsp. mobilis NCIMB 11163]
MPSFVIQSSAHLHSAKPYEDAFWKNLMIYCLISAEYGKNLLDFLRYNRVVLNISFP